MTPVHEPVSSQLLIGSPTTLYPRSQRYFTKAPILYVDVETASEEVLIKVRPYKRSLPVTDSILCSGKIGSGHRISLGEKNKLSIVSCILELFKFIFNSNLTFQ